jgi:hypothetical protein
MLPLDLAGLRRGLASDLDSRRFDSGWLPEVAQGLPRLCSSRIKSSRSLAPNTASILIRGGEIAKSTHEGHAFGWGVKAAKSVQCPKILAQRYAKVRNGNVKVWWSAAAFTADGAFHSGKLFCLVIQGSHREPSGGCGDGKRGNRYRSSE